MSETSTDTPQRVGVNPAPQAQTKPVAERKTRSAVATRQKGTSTENLVGALIKAASDPSIDVARMKEIKGIYDDIVAKDAERTFLDALAAAQRDLEPVRRNKKNEHTSSMYADFAAIMREVGPAMTPHGLSLTFRTDASPIASWVRCIATLAHRDGHKQDYPLDMPLDGVGAKGNTNKTDIQALSSSLQYCMRRLTKMIFALAEEGDDKDGNPPPKTFVAMTEEHQAILEDTCADISPTIKGAVLREYKAKSFAEIRDSEYATISRRLAKTVAEKKAAGQ